MQGIRNDLQWKILLLEHSEQIQYDQNVFAHFFEWKNEKGEIQNLFQNFEL